MPDDLLYTCALYRHAVDPLELESMRIISFDLMLTGVSQKIHLFLRPRCMYYVTIRTGSDLEEQHLRITKNNTPHYFLSIYTTLFLSSWSVSLGTGWGETGEHLLLVDVKVNILFFSRESLSRKYIKTWVRESLDSVFFLMIFLESPVCISREGKRYRREEKVGNRAREREK